MKSRVESYEVGWQRYFTCLPHAVTLLPPVMLGDAERVLSRLCTCTHSHIILKEHSDESMSPWVRESVISSSTGRKTESCPLTATSSHTSLTVSVTVVLLERERENSHCVTENQIAESYCSFLISTLSQTGLRQNTEYDWNIGSHLTMSVTVPLCEKELSVGENENQIAESYHSFTCTLSPIGLEQNTAYNNDDNNNNNE